MISLLRSAVVLCSITISTGLLVAQEMRDQQDSSAVPLRDGWFLQSSSIAGDAGESISLASFRPTNWYPVTVPSTVVGALVDSGVLDDPFFGTNLRTLPGVDYPIGKEFSNIMMPPGSPYAVPWWYRTEFPAPRHDKSSRVWLQFDGINYRANIWLNGKRIASTDEVAGTFRTFEFDITDRILEHAGNVLAVEIFAPTPNDLQLNWVDVNPTPPDKNMGLWRPVRLVVSGPVTVRDSDVIADLEMPSMNHASLRMTAEVRNASDDPINGILSVHLDNLVVNHPIHLNAKEEKQVAIEPSEHPELQLAHPRIWWPTRMGPQNLYTAKFELLIDGRISDSQAVRFGIRRIDSELTQEGHRLFKINGKPVLIRGAGWWGNPDMLLRSSPERMKWELNYAVDMGLNAIRMDGKFADQAFLNMADELGMMLLPGWCCCDHWERWNTWTDTERVISTDSLKTVIRQFRTHPSVIAWLQADDFPPPAEVEKRYAAVLRDSYWPNPYLSSATGASTTVSGPTGVKMTGPYMWVPPSYWLLDHEHGGAFGFNTETTPTESIPPIESLRQMIPRQHLEQVDEVWDFHGGGGSFTGQDVGVFAEALNARLGTPKNSEEFAAKSQLMSYEAERAMFEAYGRNKYHATGVLHEMLNSSWPALNWNLYDYFLRPGGAYFGTKKACEPIHVQFSYDNHSIVIVNSTYGPQDNMGVTVKVLDLASHELFSAERVVNVAPDSVTSVLTVPEIPNLTSVYFVALRLNDKDGNIISSNVYWLPRKEDELDWKNTTWLYTPAKVYGDFKAISDLPKAAVKLSAERTITKSLEDGVRVQVDNPSDRLAFFIRLKANRSDSGEEILPIVWQDNYLTLLPGQSVTILARYDHSKANSAPLEIVAEGMNVPRTAVVIP